MEAFRLRFSFVVIFLIFTFLSNYCNSTTLHLTKLDDENWTNMLEGEWMVEFMAPWCPACSSLKPKWEELGNRAKELGIHVAEVDVTESPGLSGRFLVTALPTIYHVLNKEVRQYSGPRDFETLHSFVLNSKWKTLSPVPWWRDPLQPHMALLSHFFRLSQMLRSIHNTLLETYGLPTYGSYLIFAIATIFLGAVLGLVVVIMFDFICPPKVRSEKRPHPANISPEAEVINDDLVDEEEEKEAQDSQEEKNSQSDSQSSDREDTSSPSVRKRKGD